MKIDIRHNFDAFKRDFSRATRDQIDKATASAINKVADQARTQMTRAIADEFEIKQSEVRNALSIRRARPGKAGIFLTAELFAFQRKSGRGFNLIRFMERKVSFAEANRRRKAGTLSQLAFKIKRGGGFKRIPGAFIGNKGRTVFMREGKERLPIKAVTTIDVPQMFNTRRINGKVVAFIRGKFPELLKRELAFYAGRA